MSKLDDLKSLIEALNKEEADSVVNHLDSGKSARKSVPRNVQLYLAIKSGDAAKLDTFCKTFAKKTFDTLVSRLYDKILDGLALDVNIQRSETYTPLRQARIQVRKSFVYVQTLVVKNQIGASILLYEKSIATAKKFEFYEELSLLMYELQNFYATTSRIEDFERLSIEITHYDEVRQEIKTLYKLYNRFSMGFLHFAEHGSQIHELEKHLSKYNADSLKSPLARWLYYRLAAEYHQAAGNNVEGYATCLKLLQLQKENPSQNNPISISITYKLLSTFCMLLYNFGEAIQFINEALLLDTQQKRNIYLTKTTAFLVHFHKGDHTKTQQIIGQIIRDTPSGESMRAAYYQACCSFLLTPSASLFIEPIRQDELEKDKEGWNIYVRLLLLMHLLENKKWDTAQAHTESLRKHLERTAKTKPIRKRLTLIYKVLRELAKNRFNFAATTQKCPEYLALLSSETDPDHRWKIISPELVRFDVWFEAKARGLDYQSVFKERIGKRSMENGELRVEN